MKRIIFPFLLLALFACQRQGYDIYKVDLISSVDKDIGIYVPVSIGDSVYPFLFDTGTSATTLSNDLVNQLNLTPDTVIYSEHHTDDGTLKDSLVLSYLSYNIGGLIYRDTVVQDKIDISEIDILSPPSLTGVLGNKLLREYNWLINFRDSTVSFSKAKIKVKDKQDDFKLSFDAKWQDQYILVDINIHDSIYKNILFDTGIGGSLKANNDKGFTDFIAPIVDLIASDTLFQQIRKDFKGFKSFVAMELKIKPKNRLLAVFDQVELNKSRLPALTIIKNIDETVEDSYIPIQFLRKFQQVYYDHVNHKINLYGDLQEH
jgi:hypothetical protein